MRASNPSRAARALAEWLAAHGETQTAFAERCGIGRVSIHSFISGRRGLSSDNAARVVMGTGGAVPVEFFRQAS